MNILVLTILLIWPMQFDSLWPMKVFLNLQRAATVLYYAAFSNFHLFNSPKHFSQNPPFKSSQPCSNTISLYSAQDAAPSVATGLINTMRTGDADLRFHITTVQDGWRKSAFLTRACLPCTVHLIMQYIEPVSEWSCWRMFVETWPHSELTFRHRASSI